MDPNIHGTPLFMLQLPEEALKKILSLSKSDAHLTRAQYTQDGKNLQYLFDHNYTSIDYQTIDVGYACKRCYLVCKFLVLFLYQINLLDLFSQNRTNTFSFNNPFRFTDFLLSKI